MDIMKIHGVDEDVAVPEGVPLLAFSNHFDGSLVCQVAYYDHRPYVRWHDHGGRPIVNVYYWARPSEMAKLVKAAGK